MLTETKKIVRKKINELSLKRYHEGHKRAALRCLRTIEAEKGKLSKKVINECDRYAKKQLGGYEYAPWLYFYSAVQGGFREGFMPNNFYAQRVVKEIEGIFALQGEMKPLSNRVLETTLLPDLLYVHSGNFYTPSTFHIIDAKTAKELLFSDYEKVIFKSNNSLQGRGVRTYTKDTWLAEHVMYESGVFQRIIKQHKVFDEIFPHPGATIRLTTALDSTGRATLRAAYLRLGRDKGSSSTGIVFANDSIRIAIDMHSGKLDSKGYMSDWRTTNTHPDTGIHFGGITIPNFQKACKQVESLHNQFPFVQCIGWDITINDKGDVEVMEWNSAHNSINFCEAVQGPCFSDIVKRSTHLLEQKKYPELIIPIF